MCTCTLWDSELENVPIAPLFARLEQTIFEGYFKRGLGAELPAIKLDWQSQDMICYIHKRRKEKKNPLNNNENSYSVRILSV